MRKKQTTPPTEESNEESHSFSIGKCMNALSPFTEGFSNYEKVHLALEFQRNLWIGSIELELTKLSKKLKKVKVVYVAADKTPIHENGK